MRRLICVFADCTSYCRFCHAQAHLTHYATQVRAVAQRFSQDGMCVQLRLRSVSTFAQSDQSTPKRLQADSEDIDSLRECAGCSESSLSAHAALLEMVCPSSYIIIHHSDLLLRFLSSLSFFFLLLLSSSFFSSYSSNNGF